MLIPFTAKWNANNACIAFCEGNGSIDSWAIIKNEAVLPGIKILATVTKNWLMEAWVLAYLNTNNSGFRRIFKSSQAWSSGSFFAINLPAAFTSRSIYWSIGLRGRGTKWISEGLLRDKMKKEKRKERKPTPHWSHDIFNVYSRRGRYYNTTFPSQQLRENHFAQASNLHLTRCIQR